MQAARHNPHRLLTLLIAWSACVLLAATIFRAGLANTPYDTVDSLGRKMGFNDSFSAEHYWIAVSNFRFGWTFEDPASIYDALLLIMQGLGAYLLLHPVWTRARRTRWFFALQPAIFFVGVIGFPLAVNYWIRFLRGLSFDRESFIDVPFVWVVAQSSWVLSSIAIAALMRVRPKDESYGEEGARFESFDRLGTPTAAPNTVAERRSDGRRGL